MKWYCRPKGTLYISREVALETTFSISGNWREGGREGGREGRRWAGGSEIEMKLLFQRRRGQLQVCTYLFRLHRDAVVGQDTNGITQ